jgi:hypothetical protein
MPPSSTRTSLFRRDSDGEAAARDDFVLPFAEHRSSSSTVSFVPSATSKRTDTFGAGIVVVSSYSPGTSQTSFTRASGLRAST